MGSGPVLQQGRLFARVTVRPLLVWVALRLLPGFIQQTDSYSSDCEGTSL